MPENNFTAESIILYTSMGIDKEPVLKEYFTIGIQFKSNDPIFNITCRRQRRVRYSIYDRKSWDLKNFSIRLKLNANDLGSELANLNEELEEMLTEYGL